MPTPNNTPTPIQLGAKYVITYLLRLEQESGAYFSLRTFEERTGMHEETVRNLIAGTGRQPEAKFRKLLLLAHKHYDVPHDSELHDSELMLRLGSAMYPIL